MDHSYFVELTDMAADLGDAALKMEVMFVSTLAKFKSRAAVMIQQL